MRERTMKLVGLLLVIFMIAGLSSSSFAAKKSKKTTTKSYSVKVPASIINGSDVTANRSFKNLSYKETTLAGIKLGDSNKKVLQKYGNPTRVIVHSEAPVVNQMGLGGMAGDMGMNPMGGMNGGMPGMMGGMNQGMGMDTMGGMNGGMPGMMGGMNQGMGMDTMGGMNGGMPGTMPGMNQGMGMNPMGGMNGTMPGMQGDNAMPPTMTDSTMPGAMNGMPGMTGDMDPMMGGMPGMMGPNGMGATTKSTPDFMGTSTKISSDSIVWQYDLSSGVQLEFIVKSGRVSQITVLSLYPWKLAQLKSGLMIGDTYKLVTYLWGINYKQQKIGSFSRMTFWDKKGVALIFLNKKLVGMTVAAGDAII